MVLRKVPRRRRLTFLFLLEADIIDKLKSKVHQLYIRQIPPAKWRPVWKRSDEWSCNQISLLINLKSTHSKIVTLSLCTYFVQWRQISNERQGKIIRETDDVGETDERNIVTSMLNISALPTSAALYKGKSLPVLVLIDLGAFVVTDSLYHSTACH